MSTLHIIFPPITTFAVKFEDMRKYEICYGSWSREEDEKKVIIAIPYRKQEIRNITGQTIWSATTVNTTFSLFVPIKCKFTMTLIFLFLFVCKLFICFCKWHNTICFDTRFWLKQNNKGHESSSTIFNVDSENLLPFGYILPRTTISFIRTDLWLLLSKDDESCDEVMKKRLLK